MSEFAYPALTVLLGYVVLGITGFGSALVIVPLLSWQWPLTEVVALALLLDVPASLLQAGLNFKNVARSELQRLLPGVLAGALLGLWLSGVLAPQWPLLALGLYISAVGAMTLRPRVTQQPIAAAAWSPWAGLLIGLIEMLFGTAGPVVAVWLSRRLSHIAALRATIPLVIAVAACTVLLAMGLSGRLSHAVLWQRWAVLLCVALLGVAIGHRLTRRLTPERVKKIIGFLLVFSGISLALHSIFKR